MIGAFITGVLGAFTIEWIRSNFPQYGDLAVAMIVSFGLGLASILSDFAPGGNTLESYLFGSISAVSKEVVLIIGLSFLVIVFFSVKYYGALLNIAMDETLAKVNGVPVEKINHLFTFLSALAIALASKIIGALMITSLIVLPVATGLSLSNSYKKTFLYSIIFGILYMITGVILSFYFNIRPGGAVILLAVFGLGMGQIIQKIKKH